MPDLALAGGADGASTPARAVAACRLKSGAGTTKRCCFSPQMGGLRFAAAGPGRPASSRGLLAEQRRGLPAPGSQRRRPRSSASEAPLGDEDPVQPSSLAGGDAAVGGGGSDNGASVNLPDRITALRRPGFKGDGVGLDAAAVAGAPQG